MISKASAPGKIILFGEHFVVHGVSAILATIDKRITVLSQKTADPFITVQSNLGTSSVERSQPCAIKELVPFHFIAKKMINDFSHTGGIKIQLESDIPHGVGLGSSSAACVAASASVSRLFTQYTKQQICDLAIQAEKTISPNSSGADCTVCTHGGIMVYKNSQYEKIQSRPNLTFIIANSNMIHSTGQMVSEVANFKEKNSARFDELCRLEQDLVEQAIQQIETRDLSGLGQTMKKNQKLLVEIGVSNDTLNNMITQHNTFSLGSKITGAGGGGCIISLVESNMDIPGAFTAKIDHTGLDFITSEDVDKT